MKDDIDGGRSAPNRLGILLQGVGAVASTFVAGIYAARAGLGKPIGALTQYGRLEGTDAEGMPPLVSDAVSLPGLDDLVFGGWDIFGGNVYDACTDAKVLDAPLIEKLAEPLKAIEVMPGAFDPNFVRRLNGTAILGGGHRAKVDALRADIRRFKAAHGIERVVVMNCSSTEIQPKPGPVHQDIDAFEAGIDANDPQISPSMMYAYAAIREGAPYGNGTPNAAADIPALDALARAEGVPVAGKDFKTGQTLVKTALAPMFAARLLGIEGWFSTNILGNRDGEVLDDPPAFQSKEATKLAVLDSILRADQYPELYGNVHHKVQINYYPPRGDAKEGWDNIDVTGWLGYPMQIKVNFLCRDSILAAPLVLDIALLLDLAARSGESGIIDWLGFYFKSPLVADGSAPEHDLFVQRDRLHAALRGRAG